VFVLGCNRPQISSFAAKHSRVAFGLHEALAVFRAAQRCRHGAVHDGHLLSQLRSTIEAVLILATGLAPGGDQNTRSRDVCRRRSGLVST
jgi:hypothetical protein